MRTSAHSFALASALRASLWLGASLAASSPAHAELFPSTATEVQTPGSCRDETQIAYSEFRSSGRKQQWLGAGATLACGVADRLDLRLGAGYADGDSAYFSVASFGARLRLLGHARSATQLTLSANLNAQGLGGEADSYSLRYRGLDLGLAARHESPAGHRLEARLGHHQLRKGPSGQSWALSYAYALTPAWELVADALGASGIKPTHALGLRWSPSQSWQLAAQVYKRRESEGAKEPLGRSLALRWTPGRAWQLTGTLSHSRSPGAGSSELTSVGLHLRHDF